MMADERIAQRAQVRADVFNTREKGQDVKHTEDKHEKTTVF